MVSSVPDGSTAIVNSNVGVGVAPEQQAHCVCIPGACRNADRSLTMDVRHVGVGVLVEQQAHYLCMPLTGSNPDGRLVLFVYEVGVGVAFEQHAHCLRTTPFGSNPDGSFASLIASVDVGAVVDQHAHYLCMTKKGSSEDTDRFRRGHAKRPLYRPYVKRRLSPFQPPRMMTLKTSEHVVSGPDNLALMTYIHNRYKKAKKHDYVKTAVNKLFYTNTFKVKSPKTYVQDMQKIKDELEKVVCMLCMRARHVQAEHVLFERIEFAAPQGLRDLGGGIRCLLLFGRP
jgi:hypothetical protein